MLAGAWKNMKEVLCTWKNISVQEKDWWCLDFSCRSRSHLEGFRDLECPSCVIQGAQTGWTLPCAPRLWVPTVQGAPIVRLYVCFEECKVPRGSYFTIQKGRILFPHCFVGETLDTAQQWNPDRKRKPEIQRDTDGVGPTDNYSIGDQVQSSSSSQLLFIDLWLRVRSTL